MSLDALRHQLTSVIRGKEAAIDLLLAAVVAGGHLLIEDLPGTGKTSLARALAASIADGDEPLSFRRIQFTPDLLPYDVTGVDVFDPAHQRFSFSPGPVFSQVLLADEINRATPKVQSALLEVMNEGQVTVGGRTYPLGEFFLVIATENPVGMEGTYPLPLAQLDRFSLRLDMGYPGTDAEIGILLDDPGRTALPGLQPVASIAQVLEARERAAAVHCRPALAQAIVSLATASREDRRLRYGISPRGGLHLLHLMRSRASLAGREFVTDEDLRALAVPVLAHRIVVAGSDHDPRGIIAGYAQSVIESLAERDRV